MIVIIIIYQQLLFAQTRIRPGEKDALNSLVFWDTNKPLYPSQKARPCGNKQTNERKKTQNKQTCWWITEWKSEKIKEETSN